MIVCNARILNAPLTGIQRYMREVLARLPTSVKTVQPPEAFQGGGLSGHIWEQSLLPLQTKGHLL